jgi:hypothetical protein
MEYSVYAAKVLNTSIPRNWRQITWNACGIQLSMQKIGNISTDQGAGNITMFLHAAALPFLKDEAYAIQIIGGATLNETSHTLIYEYLLQQFTPVPGDPADDPGNKKKMMIMVGAGAALILPLVIFKVLRDQQDAADVQAVKEKAEAQMQLSTMGAGKKKNKNRKLAPL